MYNYYKVIYIFVLDISLIAQINMIVDALANLKFFMDTAS